MGLRRNAMGRSKVPLTPERAGAVASYFERALRAKEVDALLQTAGTASKARVALDAAVRARRARSRQSMMAI